jgi:hypothetical protein
MAEHNPNDLDNFNAISTYGGNDVSLGGLGKFVIHLIILVVASAGIVYGAYRYLRSREAAVERSEVRTTLLNRGRSPNPTPEELVPAPRLQTAPIPDLAKFREDQRKALESYNWVDQGKGIVSIPIEEAKKRFLEEQAKNAPPEKVTSQEKGLPTEVMRSSQ